MIRDVGVDFFRPDGSSEEYILPDSPPSLPTPPAKPAPEPETDDEIEMLDEVPKAVAAQLAVPGIAGAKRSAPDDEDVAPSVEASKKRKTQLTDGVIEID